jgi:hypothetical protein
MIFYPNQVSYSTPVALTYTDDTFTRWYELPDELKVMVLRQHLILKHAITAENAESHTKRVLLPLAHTSKAMNSLACEVFYQENTFIAKQVVLYRDEYRIFRYPSPVFGHLVRKLELHLPIYTCFHTLQSMLESNYG